MEFAAKKEPYPIEFFTYEKMGGSDPEGEAKELADLHQRLQQKTAVERYRGIQGGEYECPDTLGATSIHVLQQLWGLPLTDLVMAYVHALHPSKVRITRGEMTLDCRSWRVTIVVDAQDRVETISQEVLIGYGTGYNLEQCLHAARTGEPPRPSSGCIGHTSRLERVDFS